MKKILLMVLCFMMILGVGCSNNKPYDEQLKLGYKYLQEELYEEALIAMNKAIEIDMKRPEAYIGLGDVYVTRCDENTVEDTNQALVAGYEKSASSKIPAAYIRLADTLVEKDKVDWAITLLRKAYERLGLEELLTKSKELEKEYLEPGTSIEMEVEGTLFNNDVYYEKEFDRLRNQHGHDVTIYSYGMRFEKPVEVLIDGAIVKIKECGVEVNADKTEKKLLPLCGQNGENWKYFNRLLKFKGYFVENEEETDANGLQYEMINGREEVTFNPNGSYSFSVEGFEELE